MNDDARIRRYEEAVPQGRASIRDIALAAIAAADEEQAALQTRWEQECANVEMAHRRAEAAEAKLAAVAALVNTWEAEPYPSTHDAGWNNGYDMRRELDTETVRKALQ